MIQIIEQVNQSIKSATEKEGRLEWGEQFANGFSDTILKTLHIHEDGAVFVVTGDIPAMWLRDSTAQVTPYLSLAKRHPVFQEMLGKLVETQCRYILIDPYANAFNEYPNSQGHQTDKTDMQPIIWERKYEIDSLCYPIQLAYKLYIETGYAAHFDDAFLKATKEIVRVFRQEQHHETSEYTFERQGPRSEDTLSHQGKGAPVAYTGMTWSGFRPSDDACHYGYLIPANMFAAVSLGQLAEIITQFYDEATFVAEILSLKTEITKGIEHFGVIEDETTKQKLYAYEVDGRGNYLLMDDANVPSLLSAPYLGFCEVSDPIYQATREFILSAKNPYFYSGKMASGIGSSHTPVNYIWPIALSMQGLTSSSKLEQKQMLDKIVATTAGTMQCHESFDVEDASHYTREWFSWSNMMFCQLVLAYFDNEITECGGKANE